MNAAASILVYLSVNATCSCNSPIESLSVCTRILLQVPPPEEGIVLMNLDEALFTIFTIFI